ncbi:MFS transporter [Candidatus Woesearchaeota archaeon]|nr:MFS transporter [Candidatus Woesearchaeota archaeon]
MSDHKHEYVVMFLNCVLPCLTSFFMPVYFKSIGLNGWQMGVLMAIGSLVMFLASFPIGMINDNVMSKIMVFISMLLMASYYFGLAVAKNFWILAALYVIWGVSGNLFRLSLDSLIMKRVGHDGKGRSLGLYVFSNGIGSAIGFFIGGLILNVFTFKTAFLITGVSALVLSVYSLFLPRTMVSTTKLKDYIKDVKDKTVLWMALLYFLLAYHWGPEKTSVSLFLKEDAGLSMMQSGLVLCIALVFLGTTGYVLGKRYDKKLSLKRIVAFGLFMSGLGNVGWYFTTQPLLVLLFRVTHEIGDGAFAIFIYLAITEVFKKERLGGNTALMGIVSVLGSVTGTVLSGGLGGLYGNAFPIFLSGILTLAALMIVPKLQLSNVKEQKNLY